MLKGQINDPINYTKTYWSLVKAFINVKNTSDILTLLFNNRLVSYFKEKTNFFKHCLVQQCQLFVNDNILSTNQIYETYERPRDFDIACGKILKLIDSSNPNRVHGHDDILKACSSYTSIINSNEDTFNYISKLSLA